MEKQVLSIEQMQELNALGIDVSKASMCYCILTSDEYTFGKALVPNSDTFCNSLYRELVIPTFTLQDILKLLPKHSWSLDSSGIVYKITQTVLQPFLSENPIDAAFEMLKWCIKNKYI